MKGSFSGSYRLRIAEAVAGPTPLSVEHCVMNALAEARERGKVGVERRVEETTEVGEFDAM